MIKGIKECIKNRSSESRFKYSVALPLFEYENLLEDNTLFFGLYTLFFPVIFPIKTYVSYMDAPNNMNHMKTAYYFPIEKNKRESTIF